MENKKAQTPSFNGPAVEEESAEDTKEERPEGGRKHRCPWREGGEWYREMVSSGGAATRAEEID